LTALSFPLFTYPRASQPARARAAAGPAAPARAAWGAAEPPGRRACRGRGRASARTEPGPEGGIDTSAPRLAPGSTDASEGEAGAAAGAGRAKPGADQRFRLGLAAPWIQKGEWRARANQPPLPTHLGFCPLASAAPPEEGRKKGEAGEEEARREADARRRRRAAAEAGRVREEPVEGEAPFVCEVEPDRSRGTTDAAPPPTPGLLRLHRRPTVSTVVFPRFSLRRSP
jgi:hypothetical protein